MNDMQFKTVESNINRAKYLTVSCPDSSLDHSSTSAHRFDCKKFYLQFESPEWIELSRITTLAKEFF